jgi:2-polyprenyl-3-methyl-5-hydroxy-6-metoxy-1,4-benzoquinol methylase
VTHAIGRANGWHYFEDFVRVYPDDRAYSRLGLRRPSTRFDRNNFVNHRKFYDFAAQFARGRRVVDVGCGSGYGCKILAEAGAAKVSGCDVSRAALRHARERFGTYAELSRQDIANLAGYPDSFADVVVCSEVLEHIREYGREDRALEELRRITARDGIVIVGTPNSELLDGHGFSFEELTSLFAERFDAHCVFENALVPEDSRGRESWERRRAAGRVGVVVSERIDFTESCVADGGRPEVKEGRAPGMFSFCRWCVDTTRLHNTHSWVVLAAPSVAPRASHVDS